MIQVVELDSNVRGKRKGGWGRMAKEAHTLHYGKDLVRDATSQCGKEYSTLQYGARSAMERDTGAWLSLRVPEQIKAEDLAE